ncbi:restriction endonuclease subunit S [Thalassoglobus neptunius]|nr:restriction endonuclease subunit S [Thalassoglobus neptunius]
MSKSASAPNGDSLKWKTVRFDEVVRNVKDKVDRENTDLTRYVAGDHMDSEDIHLRRWGELNGDYLGPAFHRRFREGQVLYGSRRTYLKKVAVAPFDGITANTTFVLESKDSETLIPAILPFLMLTDDFTEHSIRESKGSVNPYVNWKDIAKFRFALPPVDEQHSIVQLLTSADDVAEHYRRVWSDAASVVDALTIQLLSADWPHQRCETLLVGGPRNGLSPKCNADGRGAPTIAIGAVREGRILTEGNLKYAEVSADDLAKFRLNRGDVLVVRGNGNRDLCGRCGMVDAVPTDCFYPDLLIKLDFDEKVISPEFAVVQWNHRLAHARLLKQAKSTNGIWKINGKDIKQHELSVPPIDVQRRFVNELEDPQKAMAAAENARLAADRLTLRLANALLGAQSHVH